VIVNVTVTLNLIGPAPCLMEMDYS